MDVKGTAFINKGGLAPELSEQNLNYGIWIDSKERIVVVAGFETTSGTNKFVYSSLSYNDGNWHNVVVTFAGPKSALKLFIDGNLVDTRTSTASPDNTGTQPVRIGANSLALKDYFVGNIDEVRIWERALTSIDVSSAFRGTFSVRRLVFYHDFGTASDTGNTNQAIDVSQLRGVNCYDPILMKTELGLPEYLGVDMSSGPSTEVSLTQIHDRGFNLVRVPFHWEAYSNDIEGVLAEMEAIASAADKVGIRVFFDSHQYKTSSYFYGNAWAVGFLRFLWANTLRMGERLLNKHFGVITTIIP
jgi:hypothetical protein